MEKIPNYLVQSILVTYEGSTEREIHNVTGGREIEIAARAEPGSTTTIEVSAYEGEEIRGRLLGKGSSGPIAIS